MSHPTEFHIGKYRVRWDGSHNWVIEVPVTRKRRGTGETYGDYEILGYYGDKLQDAARRLYREELTGKGQQDMKSIADLILKSEDKLEKAITSALEAHHAD